MRRETECMDEGLNQAVSIERRWKKQGDITDMPRAVEGMSRNYAASSRWVEDASYLKLKDISLTYNFDHTLLQRTFIKSLSVWVSGMNLLTWSKYKGVDPEVGLIKEKPKPSVWMPRIPLLQCVSLLGCGQISDRLDR